MLDELYISFKWYHVVTLAAAAPPAAGVNPSGNSLQKRWPHRHLPDAFRKQSRELADKRQGKSHSRPIPPGVDYTIRHATCFLGSIFRCSPGRCLVILRTIALLSDGGLFCRRRTPRKEEQEWLMPRCIKYQRKEYASC